MVFLISQANNIKELDIGSVRQQHECIFLEHDFNGDEIDKDIADYLIGAMVAINYSQINESEKAKILEVLKMARPFEDLYKEFELKGREEGRQEGIWEERKEVAKRLLQNGTDIVLIKKVTQ